MKIKSNDILEIQSKVNDINERLREIDLILSNYEFNYFYELTPKVDEIIDFGDGTNRKILSKSTSINLRINFDISNVKGD